MYVRLNDCLQLRTDSVKIDQRCSYQNLCICQFLVNQLHIVFLKVLIPSPRFCFLSILRSYSLHILQFYFIIVDSIVARRVSFSNSFEQISVSCSQSFLPLKKQNTPKEKGAVCSAPSFLRRILPAFYFFSSFTCLMEIPVNPYRIENSGVSHNSGTNPIYCAHVTPRVPAM